MAARANPGRGPERTAHRSNLQQSDPVLFACAAVSQPVPPQRPLPMDRQLLQTLLDQGLRTIVTVPCSITAGWHAWADEASHQVGSSC